MARIDLGKVVGDSATISVGNVTTLEAGQNATVVNTGTELNGVFDFGIPKGPKGDKGDTGSQGPVGPQGVQGKAFTIDKTYSSVLDMQADFNNMEVGSYVMIASNVESEDNARLYYRDTNEWKFISDFSGATGIQGEQGPQGQAGYTPVKGVDYFTSADIAEIEDDIKEITGELANLDTTDKTNLVSAINEVASAGGGDGNTVIIPDCDNFYGNTALFQRIFDLMVEGKSVIFYQKTESDTHVSHPGTYIYVSPKIDNLNNTYTGSIYFKSQVVRDIVEGINIENYKLYTVDSFYRIKITINNGVVTYVDNPISYIKSTNNKNHYELPILGKNNTASYTPTNDYNPATKKYVDDSIASAITSALGGSY